MVLRLTKHHGAGNDFLVLLDLDGLHPVDADLARSLCARNRGIGADGVIRATRGDNADDLVFALRNADGSVAETSGNGLRCLGQAAIDAGILRNRELEAQDRGFRGAVPPVLRIRTANGLRAVTVGPETSPGVRDASVEMGIVEIGPDAPRWVTDASTRHGGAAVVERATFAQVENPHLVLLVPDPGAVDVSGVGTSVNASPDGPINVEFVRADDPSHLTMRVFERGVGETQACGSGACAAVAAAISWGLTSSGVTVSSPGGELTVDINEGGATLSGPVVHVCDVEWPCR